MPSPRLSRCMVPPSRIASILDWKRKGSVIMALDITEQRIGVAVAKHPTPNNKVYALETISYMPMKNRHSLRRLEQNDRVASELEEVVEDYKVCAFIVGWPLQPDGRSGGPCGKVLHLLDYFAEREKPLLSQGRPCALWDARDIPRNILEERKMIIRQKEHVCDKWGRSPSFCHTPSSIPGNYIYRSHDQFQHVSTIDSTAASLLLKDFLDSHWEPADKEEDEIHHYEDDLHFDHAVNDSFDDEEHAYIARNLL